MLEELRAIPDPHIIGTYHGQLVVTGSGLDNLRLLAPSDYMSALAFTHANNSSSVHLSLVESYNLYDQSMPADVFSQEVSGSRPVPKNLSEALSPPFVGEYGPAMDKENAGFVAHKCFEAVPLPAGARVLPTRWLYTTNEMGLLRRG